MAFRKSTRRTRRSTSYGSRRGSTARRRGYGGARRSSSGRRVSAGARTVRIEIVQPGQSVARPPLSTMTGPGNGRSPF